MARAAFDEERFPDDAYGLTPASLGAVHPSLVEPARASGAARAMALKARPGPSGHELTDRASGVHPKFTF